MEMKIEIKTEAESTFPECNVALKEWNATVSALESGRQILLLRKGGLLDPEGRFEVEFPRFWLAPTRFHQDATLLKEDEHHLLGEAPAGRRKILPLRSFATVEKTWAVEVEEESKLEELHHIWSRRWLETRFDYQPENPLLVLALRVFVLPQPHTVTMRPEYFGCKSWIEMEEPLDGSGARAALESEEFLAQLEMAEQVLGA